MNETAPIAPTRHKLDVAAFYRMAEAGIIGQHDRIELIDGDLIDMPPIGDDHANAVDWLNERLVLASHGRAVTSVQNPLRLDLQNQPRPDLVLYRRTGKKGTERGPSDTIVVIEVADSSLAYDGTIKRELYAKFAISEYWIVDVQNQTLIVCRQPSADGYADVTTMMSGTRIALAAAPDIVLDLDQIFD